MRSSASSFERNGGCTRNVAGNRRRRWRAARPSGPSTRTTTSLGVNRPRRTGRMGVRTVAAPDAGTVMLARRVAACSDGASSSATATCNRRLVGLVTRQLTSPSWSIVSTAGSDRSTPMRPGAGASSQSAAATASSSPSSTSRPCAIGTSGSSSRTPASASATSASRRVGTGISGGGNRRQDAVEHDVGRGALELGLRAQLDAVAQRRLRHRLHLVRRHVGTAGEPRPGLGRVQQRGRAAGDDTPSVSDGASRVARHSCTMYAITGGSTRSASTWRAGRSEIGCTGDGTDSGRGEIVRSRGRGRDGPAPPAPARRSGSRPAA